ncbi:hypothetical protein ACLMJK_007146 [Lecanora helva]
MSTLWPHTLYAEDQPHATAILSTHVLFRGFQTGAVIGPLIGVARYAIRRHRAGPTQLMFPTMIRSAGTGGIVGVGILALALVGRMQGREDIEWRDRAWRLLENKGQMEVDTWSLVGSGAGAGAAAVWGRGSGIARIRGVVGGMGLGGTAGVLWYMVWKHGINGGKWQDD